MASKILSDFYRVPEDALSRVIVNPTTGPSGFFRFGPESICYGQFASGVSEKADASDLGDALGSIRLAASEVYLPFDPTQIVENLRRERYMRDSHGSQNRLVDHPLVRKLYYFVREALPISARRHLQKAYLSGWRKLRFPEWPVDFTVDLIHERLLRLSMQACGVQRIPFIWFWPDGAASCLIMTHDVEAEGGRDFTSALIALDESYGVRASFQVVPERRYEIPENYIEDIRRHGFEFNIHDLNHDGQLYGAHETFLRRARKINEYAKTFGARGFRAGAMYRNLDWYGAYEFSYDMSVPNVAHLEPQRGGCCTVFPYFVDNILEIPLTTAQDYSIFQILGEYSIDLWKAQVDMILKRNGLISFIAHPDYLIPQQARGVYTSLLDYLRQLIVRENIWAPLPGDVDRWWRARSEMKLVQKSDHWEIEGPQKERARVAFAVLKGDRLTYELPGGPAAEGAVL